MLTSNITKKGFAVENITNASTFVERRILCAHRAMSLAVGLVPVPLRKRRESSTRAGGRTA